MRIYMYKKKNILCAIKISAVFSFNQQAAEFNSFSMWVNGKCNNICWAQN